MTTTIAFNGQTYTQQTLETLGGSDLVKLFNAVVDTMKGTAQVKRFADKKSAVRRTWDALTLYSANQPKPAEAEKTVPQPKPKKAAAPAGDRKARGMYFVFPVESEIRTVTRKSKDGKSTLRARCVDMLLEGAPFEKVIDLCVAWDKENGIDRSKVKGGPNLSAEEVAEVNKRRAYELVRIMHYYLGYGMRLLADGRVQIYASK